MSRGSGFIAELEVEKQKKWLLFTCNHVLPSLPDAMKSGIYFGRKSNDQKGTLIQGKDLFGEELFFKTDGTNVRWSLCLQCNELHLYQYSLLCQL